MTNFNKAMEGIGQAVSDHYSNSTPPEVKSLLMNLQDAYVLVQWPESQDLMEEEWFSEEAILDVNSSAAYFVPLKRII